MTNMTAATGGAIALALVTGLAIMPAEAGMRHDAASLPVAQPATVTQGEAVTITARDDDPANAGFTVQPSARNLRADAGQQTAAPALRSGARADDASLPIGQTAGWVQKPASQPRQQAPSSSARSGRAYADHIARHAQAAGVPVALAMAVVRIESNHNPKARGRAGEVGLMQIKPQTARGIGFSGSTSALYDPDTNLKWGMKYLAGAYKLAGGDTCGTILRYQGGHGARRMTSAASAYCGRVKRHMAGQNV